jgi:enediyne biosynthesis protein E4
MLHIGHRSFRYAMFVLALLLPGCQSGRQAAPPPAALKRVPAEVTHTGLAPASACDGHFVPRTLGVANGMRMREIRTYASNGAGLAAGDLDGDGDIDLVFASVDRESTILWNDGGLTFTPEPLDDQLTRAVNIVDVNGDGMLDIVFTHRSLAGVSYWRNQGRRAAGGRFAREPLPGVDHYAYSMAWADLNDDGSLDLVTGAYDVDLKSNGVAQQQIADQGGVTLYQQRAGRFTAQQLTPRSEALSLGLVDLNGDGRSDIWAANDFALPDAIWLRRGDSWENTQPFQQTSYSTMSIDWGDLANDGRLALFTTDMNPGDIALPVLAAWLPVISKLEEKHGPNDPQIMANVLQIQSSGGGWRNEAAWRGVDATGWSWGGKFGDLDNDGFLDLYVVNGMIAQNLFQHLQDGELVEENRAFRNRGDGSFLPAPEWDLASTASGRSMLMADLDGDGDLDIVVNNMRGQAQLFENRLCGGAALEVDVAWPSSANSHAIGAQLELYTSAGVLRRDIRAASGYLAGDQSRVHFGFPRGTTLQKLIVRFPDGAAAELDSLEAQTLLKVTR